MIGSRRLSIQIEGADAAGMIDHKPCRRLDWRLPPVAKNVPPFTAQHRGYAGPGSWAKAPKARRR